MKVGFSKDTIIFLISALRYTCSSDLPSEHPRVITAMKSLPNENLGVAIVGQLNFGIFVKEVQPNSCVFGHDGLRCGDQILEVRYIYILLVMICTLNCFKRFLMHAKCNMQNTVVYVC